MNKRILGSFANNCRRAVSYRFHDQFLFDSIPIESFNETEAKGKRRRFFIFF